MKTFEQLLTEAKELVKEISKHPEVAEIFHFRLLNRQETISQMWDCIAELNDAHHKMTEKQTSSTPLSEAKRDEKMQDLIKIYDSTLLRTNATYQIDGCLYRFLSKDPYSSVESPKFTFRPLPGQRKQNDLILNKRQLTNRCYEVEGMPLKDYPQTTQSVQLALF